MSVKATIEALVYAADEPITLEQIFALVKAEARQELAELRSNEAQRVSEMQNEITAESGAEVGLDDTAIEDAPGRTAEAPANAPGQATDAEVKSAIRAALEELVAEYDSPQHGIEVRQVAGGYRMATKPEKHDAVRAFAKSLKPPIRLSLPALETLAVVAYKQPITAPEIGEIRGVDTSGVLGTLLDRKLITTAGRKQVVGRPILYKTTKEFLMRFGLKDVGELPSMEEFEKLAAESLGVEEKPAELPFDEAKPDELNATGPAEAAVEDDGLLGEEKQPESF
jgi:segregation and condensation protein B